MGNDVQSFQATRKGSFKIIIHKICLSRTNSHSQDLVLSTRLAASSRFSHFLSRFFCTPLSSLYSHADHSQAKLESAFPMQASTSSLATSIAPRFGLSDHWSLPSQTARHQAFAFVQHAPSPRFLLKCRDTAPHEPSQFPVEIFPTSYLWIFCPPPSSYLNHTCTVLARSSRSLLQKSCLHSSPLLRASCCTEDSQCVTMLQPTPAVLSHTNSVAACPLVVVSSHQALHLMTSYKRLQAQRLRGWQEKGLSWDRKEREERASKKERGFHYWQRG